MLPLRYALRNLGRDPSRLLQTVAGSALVTLMTMGAGAISQGMDGVLRASGSERNVILLGAGSEESVLRSEVNERAAGIAEGTIRGIAEMAGARAISPEIHQLTFVTVRGDRTRCLVRGVTPGAVRVHPDVSVIQGRFPGAGEVMVGRLAWRRLGVPPEWLDMGEAGEMDAMRLKVAGIFAAPSTVMESEVWMDLNDMRTLAQRNNLSCVVLRMGKGNFSDADLFARQRLDLELTAVREKDYYARLSRFYAPIRVMTWVTALLMATGAVLGGLNTLYAAFASRIREIATLQAIGFRRWMIAVSLVEESMMACLCGALAAAMLAVSALDGLIVSFSIGSFVLQVTPGVAAIGLVTGLTLGIVGAVPPALRCLLPPLPSALRAAG